MPIRPVLAITAAVLAISACTFSDEPTETTGGTPVGNEPSLGEPIRADEGDGLADNEGIGKDDDQPMPDLNEVQPVMPTEQTLESATAASKVASERFTTGDFPSLYSMSTSEVTGALTQPQFIEAMSTCASQTLPVEVKPGEMVNDTTATTTWESAGMSAERTMKFEGGTWKVGPSPVLGKNLGKSVDEIKAAMTAESSC